MTRDASALRDALAGLVRVCRFVDRGTICCHDVSVTQCNAVDALVRRGPLTLNELAAEIYLDKTTASRVVGTLVRKKYVGRKAHAGDRRSIILRATASGRRLLEAIRREQMEDLARLLAGIDPGVRAVTTEVIGRLARAIADRCGGDAGPLVCGTGCSTEAGGGGGNVEGCG